MSEIRYGYHADWIRRHAERMPDRLAQVDLVTGRRFTYGEMHRRINRLANFMRDELGLKPGDRASILARSSTDFFEVVFACSRVGVILNTLNWRLAVPELQYILNDCTPKALFYEGYFAEQVAALRPTISADKFVVMGEAAGEDAIPYEEALSRSPETNIDDGPRLTYEDTWCILYTSGTTGRPKGAMVTYGNFFYNAVGMGQAIDLTSNDINLLTLPTFHAGGLGLYSGPTFHAGGTVLIMRDFDPGEMLRVIEEWQVTIILLVPSMYLMLRDHPDFSRYDLSSMRLWSSGGSSLPPSVVHEFADKDIIIQQGMGMTETGPTIFLINKEDALRMAGSVGKPVMHTDVCIMDQHDRMLGPNEVGELCIRGSITTGYWNAPEKTAEAIRDGWLHSGDAAKYDDEGFYTIVDRWKDMFISGGENVYPAEVESVLYHHPAIAEVAVVGVPHPKWQEVGRAVVVLKPGESLTDAEVIDFCQGKLAKYKIPKAVSFLDALPRNDIGKVMKTELQQMYRDLEIA
ncbi:MAG: long-chain fatty acid--CoA ligase [Chloroflexota bacterium]